ncbi:MAG: molybdenum cofactor biosynthesis protein B [Gammaproteobacteria bacterium]|nr:molybdenum cofactor biosynthesis protein B [Gammaproteobacteria bacterium]
MAGHFDQAGFVPLNIAVLTVSDTRTEATDKSGKILSDGAEDAGHQVVEKEIVKDDVYQMRAVFSRWIADPNVHVILSTGGTGIAGRDSTPEAVMPLLDKPIEGFGELFRSVSMEEIGASAIQSRAIAGLTNQTLIFCLPGSTGACRTGWSKILQPQLDHRTRPCNFAQMFRA